MPEDNKKHNLKETIIDFLSILLDEEMKKKSVHLDKIDLLNQKITTKQHKIDLLNQKVSYLANQNDKYKLINDISPINLDVFLSKFININNSKIEIINTEKIPKHENKINELKEKVSKNTKSIHKCENKISKIQAIINYIKSFNIIDKNSRREHFINGVDKLNNIYRFEITKKINKHENKITKANEVLNNNLSSNEDRFKANKTLKISSYKINELNQNLERANLFKLNINNLTNTNIENIISKQENNIINITSSEQSVSTIMDSIVVSVMDTINIPNVNLDEALPVNTEKQNVQMSDLKSKFYYLTATPEEVAELEKTNIPFKKKSQEDGYLIKIDIINKIDVENILNQVSTKSVSL